MVQFAKDRRNDLEYAIKFFLSYSAFKDEASLYTDHGNPLGQFLPEVRNITGNEDEAFKDAYGAPMAPCIAMERGESLDIWSARNKNGLDMITGLQVCAAMQLLGLCLLEPLGPRCSSPHNRLHLQGARYRCCVNPCPCLLYTSDAADE